MGQQGKVWTRIAKGRESCRSLAEGYFLLWKDTAQHRIDEKNADPVWQWEGTQPNWHVSTLIPAWLQD